MFADILLTVFKNLLKIKKKTLQLKILEISLFKLELNELLTFILVKGKLRILTEVCLMPSPPLESPCHIVKNIPCLKTGASLRVNSIPLIRMYVCRYDLEHFQSVVEWYFRNHGPVRNCSLPSHVVVIELVQSWKPGHHLLLPSSSITVRDVTNHSWHFFPLDLASQSFSTQNFKQPLQ